MRQLLQTTAIIAPLLIGSAWAQEAQQAETGQEAEETQEAQVAEPIVREQGESELRVDWITGTTVRSPQGESIGQVEDLILEQDTGQLSAAVLSVGGFLGFGAKQIAVDWDELQIDYDAQEITLDLTRQEAEDAPEYAFRDQKQPPPPPMPEPALDQPTGGTEAPQAPAQEY